MTVETRYPALLKIDGGIGNALHVGTEYRVVEITEHVDTSSEAMPPKATVIRFDPAGQLPPADGDIQRRCWTLYMHPDGNGQCRLFNGHEGDHDFGGTSA